jgi:hypothetical protein
MIEKIGPYYERPNDGFRDRYDRGQVCEGLVPYSGDEAIWRLEIAAGDSSDPDPWYRIVEDDLRGVRSSEADPELGLDRGEALVVREAKSRRVIILSGRPASWTGSENVFLVAPIYRFQARDSEDLRSRIKAYAYNTLFYLPGSEEHEMYEGYARLDRVQPVNATMLEYKPVRLTQAALDCLTLWFGGYVTQTVPRRIEPYRNEALRQLRN